MKYLQFDKIDICRCERDEYSSWGPMHYLKGLGKGAICFKFIVDNEDAVFASLLSMPIKGYTNCLIFHRIIVSKKFQNYGLSSLVLNLVAGIYYQEEKLIYIKTSSKK